MLQPSASTFAPSQVANASGLFNLMHNLGGPISLALLDTIIYGRGHLFADRILDGLANNDVGLMRRIGVPKTTIHTAPDSLLAEKADLVLRPLVEHQSLTFAINEAWAPLALFVLLGLAALPFASRRRTSQ